MDDAVALKVFYPSFVLLSTEEIEFRGDIQCLG